MNDYQVVFPNGTIFTFTYEEMVELSLAGFLSEPGGEYHATMKDKAQAVYDALPSTDY